MSSTEENRKEAVSLDEVDDLPDGITGPTFEDLAIDDSLSDVERISKYVVSSIALQRLVHVKMIGDISKELGYEKTCKMLLPLLEPLVYDMEYVVRQHLVFQLLPICNVAFAQGGEDGYNTILEKILPLLAVLAADPQAEVRLAAADSLVSIANMVKVEDQGAYVLTIVLPLAHEDDKEDIRIAAVVLLNQLAESFGPDLCHQFAAPELVSLSEDPVFRVRKATALNFHNVCKVAGPLDTKERLLPAFLGLAKDDIWGVRKACAESLVGISSSLDIADRGPLLVSVFEAFINDASKWVRSAAFQYLGQFISTLRPEDITDKILQYFTWVASTPLDVDINETELQYHCAYSFPGVAMTVGRDRWPALHGAYESLAQHRDVKVRRTLSFSLHELAKILGPELIEKHLLIFFETFQRDIDQVKVGVITHLAEFMEQLTPQVRNQQIKALIEVTETFHGLNWRLRHALANQLVKLCNLLQVDTVHESIYPLVFQLCKDDVATVREASFLIHPALLKALSSNEEWKMEYHLKICELGKSTHFIERQIFLGIMKELFAEDSVRADALGHHQDTLKSLAKDSVINVRLALAQLALLNSALQDVIQQLQGDIDPEIRNVLQRNGYSISSESIKSALAS